jgi:O-antigen/teichoic acid export membrane protein
MSLFVLFIALAIITFRSLIIYILGSDYSDSIDIIPFLTLMPLLLLLSEVTVVGINFKKKTKWHILISLISLLINVIGNYFLINAYGAVGAAISTGISYLVYYFLRTYISNKLFKVNYPTKRFNVSIIIILLFAYTSIFLLNSISTYLIGIILILLLMILYKNEILEIHDYIKKHIKKLND